MKHTIRTLLATTVLALSAQAHAVVESGHIQLNTTLRTDLYAPVNFTLSVNHSETSPNQAGVLMYFASGSLKGVGITADEGADVFLVKAGDVFSNASVTNSPNQTYIYGTSGGSGIPAPVFVDTDFYLGIRTRSFADPGFQDAAANNTLNSFFTSFGWAHVGLDAQGKVQLLDSAMAFREGGIVVGTLQAVPEPATVALTSLGLLGLTWRARANRRRSRSQ